MTKKKKLLIGVLVATMALTGVLVGSVSADTEDADNPRGALMARVAEILGIDQADVEDAFEQAMEEQREQIEGQREERQAEMEAARDAHIQSLIDEGIVTQEEVDEWEAWMESRPDNREAMQEWMESRPDLGEDFPLMQRGGKMLGGMGDRDKMPGGMAPRGMMPGGCGGPLGSRTSA